jgi:hypothetical protein
LLAVPLTPLSDRLAAWSTRRNHGIREAEMRLPILFIPCFIGPAGLLLYGMMGETKGPWIGYMIGSVMLQFAAYFYFTNSLAYAIDSYNSNLPEMLIIMNIGKQAISFGVGYGVLNWILADGYVKVIAAAFTVTLFLICACCFVLYFFGKKIRVATSKGALARLHQRSVREVGVH